MALIKVDPAQSKTVAALIGVLVVTVGVTVVRLKPQQMPRAAAQQQQRADTPDQAETPGDRVRPDLSRNPFERAAKARAQITEGMGPEAGGPLASITGGGEPTRKWMGGSAPREPFDLASVMPMNPFRDGQTPAAAGSPSAKHGGADAGPAQAMDGQGDRSTPEAKPVFALLATVRSSSGYSAVIKSGDAGARVVEVGDVMDNGYRVRMITADHVVLTDGRENVIAKRPQS